MNAGQCGRIQKFNWKTLIAVDRVDLYAILTST